MQIYITGLHSDANPLPGTGVARSLREAFPDADLIGVDYSERSSGLHCTDFDNVFVPGEWHLLDLNEYARTIRRILESGAMWISCLDLETHWLSAAVGRHPKLLVPPSPALLAATKPAVEVSRLLKIPRPSHLALGATERELHAFLRKAPEGVWLKGPWYGAVRVGNNWPTLVSAREQLRQTWSTTDLFLQQHVSGQHESVVFAAHNGRLLGAALMRKTIRTLEGKTWAGEVSSLHEDLLRELERCVKNLSWTGGGEVECIRDNSGTLWLMEVNPRFPAWIHGTTLSGINLPGALVGVVGQVVPARPRQTFSSFARLVIEVPAHREIRTGCVSEYALPALGNDDPVAAELAQLHPSGMPSLAAVFAKNAMNLRNTPDEDAQNVALRERLLKLLQELPETPARVLLEDDLSERLEQTRICCELASDDNIKLRAAYSLKTNPDRRILDLARRSGFLIDAISQLESLSAVSAGFSADRIILNGPAKFWPRPLVQNAVGYLFCDSVEELRRIRQLQLVDKVTSVLGLRIRPTNLGSRFGVAVPTVAGLAALSDELKSLPSQQPLGLQFHIPSSTIGVAGWWQLFNSMVGFAETLANLAARSFAVLDVGGGWEPTDWDKVLHGGGLETMRRRAQHIPGLREVIFELGKSLVQPTMVLVSRVLDVRRNSDGTVDEIVVDASIAELPDIANAPHRTFFSVAATGELLSGGNGHAVVLGRLCMESDVLVRGIAVPKHIGLGDCFIVCDAGAYDASMSFAFGVGSHSGQGRSRAGDQGQSISSGVGHGG